MRKLYEKKEVLFAVLWIVAYCLAMTPVKGQFGYGSIWMLLVLAAFAAGMTVLVKKWKLEGKYGLVGWPKDMNRYLYFIPMWVLATGNLWDGFAPSYRGMTLAIATLSMLLVGYVEELLFRGFLFKAMLGNGKAIVAIIVSAVTFGMGHIKGTSITTSRLTMTCPFFTICRRYSLGETPAAIAPLLIFSYNSSSTRTAMKCGYMSDGVDTRKWVRTFWMK